MENTSALIPFTATTFLIKTGPGRDNTLNSRQSGADLGQDFSRFYFFHAFEMAERAGIVSDL